jgi:biotin carboxyl carrier protein
VKLQIQIGGVTRELEVTREGGVGAGGRVRWRLNGKPLEADELEVARGVYSILIGGQSLEVRVEESGSGLRVHAGGEEFRAKIIDARQWRRRRGSTAEAEGLQQVVASMPGKVVHVLVNAGYAVESGQGLVVVEAMKMQNEIRSPKTGKVERLLVTEGQAVNSGEVLAIIS